jgi:hypothetical protein
MNGYKLELVEIPVQERSDGLPGRPAFVAIRFGNVNNGNQIEIAKDALSPLLVVAALRILASDIERDFAGKEMENV